MFKGIFTGIAILVFSASGAAGAGTDLLEKSIKKEILKNFSGARIQLISAIRPLRGQIPAQVHRVSLLAENGRGQAQLILYSPDGGSAEVLVNFQARVNALVAKKRIFPGERIERKNFELREINIAVGNDHEYRGVIADPSADVETHESRLSILEGQPLYTTSIQKIPDLRRGDGVRVDLISAELRISVPAVALEPANSGAQVRVMTKTTKRELVGRLKEGGTVEVKL